MQHALGVLCPPQGEDKWSSSHGALRPHNTLQVPPRPFPRWLADSWKTTAADLALGPSLTRKKNQKRVALEPLSHGGRKNQSPKRPSKDTLFCFLQSFLGLLFIYPPVPFIHSLLLEKKKDGK